MDKRNLNYKINNPNTVDTTADMLFKFFIDINKPKLDNLIKESFESPQKNISHSA